MQSIAKHSKAKHQEHALEIMKKILDDIAESCIREGSQSSIFNNLHCHAVWCGNIFDSFQSRVESDGPIDRSW